MDFGDGIGRHPTQAYEMLFLAALVLGLYTWQRRGTPQNGQVFRMFLAAYFAWRLLIDFLKPQPLVHGLNAIQWSCLLGLAWLTASALKSRQSAATPATLTA